MACWNGKKLVLATGTALLFSVLMTSVGNAESRTRHPGTKISGVSHGKHSFVPPGHRKHWGGRKHHYRPHKPGKYYKAHYPRKPRHYYKPKKPHYGYRGYHKRKHPHWKRGHYHHKPRWSYGLYFGFGSHSGYGGYVGYGSGGYGGHIGYGGYGHYHKASDALKWIAFTAITLKLIDVLNENQRRAHESAQIRATEAPVGRTIRWRDGRAQGDVVALRDGRDSSGHYCREFQQTITVGGKRERGYGTACRRPDGAWQIVSTR